MLYCTWTGPEFMTPGDPYSGASIDPDGIFYQDAYHAWSNDGGNTWTYGGILVAAHQIADAFAHPANHLQFEDGNFYAHILYVKNPSPMMITDGTGPMSDLIYRKQLVGSVNSFLSLLAPNGGEKLKIGDTFLIRWTSYVCSNIKIEFCSDFGTKEIWSTIAENVPANNGSFIWTVPDITSSNCKIRITDMQDINIQDESFGVFSVSPTGNSWINLNSPNGGEQLRRWHNQIISWNCNEVENVKLEYTTDFNEAKWNYISTVTTSDSGFYNWIVPDDTSSTCKIRITSVENSFVTDKSDNVFRILGQLYEIEPNNDNSTANEIQLSDTLFANLGEVSDVDFFKFYNNANDTIVVIANTRNESDFRGKIQLYNELGELLSENDFFLDYKNQRVVYIIPVDGWYYIRYSSFEINNSISKNVLEDQYFSQHSQGNKPSSNVGEYFISLNKFFPGIPLHIQSSVGNILPNSFQVSSVFYPNGNETTVQIEYGTSASLGNSVTYPGIFNSFDRTIMYGFKINNIVPNTHYYIRVNLSNPFGSTYSDIMEIQTPVEAEGWILQQSNFNGGLYGVEFLNEDVGFACGHYGTLLKTTNGGNEWSNTNVGIDETLMGIQFIDNNIGYLFGYHHVFKTTDGGNTWVIKYIASDNIFWEDIHFLNSNFGFLVARGGVILKTTDGGDNWTQLSSGTTDDYYAVYCLSESTILIVGEDCAIKSSNSGNTWSPIQMPFLGQFREINFVGNCGYIVGPYPSVILKSTDYGNSWVTVNNGPNEFLNTIEFSDPFNGIAAGSNGLILETSDAGNTWHQVNSGTTVQFWDITNPLFHKATLVSYYGTILRQNYFDLDYSVNLGISDFPGGKSSSQIIFGQKPTATDGIDNNLGEYELPPIPPFGEFDARFILPNLINTSLTDFRNSEDSHIVWELQFQPGPAGYPIMFNWDIFSLPDGRIEMKDVLGGTFVNVDMRTTNEYILTNSSINKLIIELWMSKCNESESLTGWNLMSVPYNSPSMNIDDLFPTATSQAFVYNGMYTVIDSANAGQGFWLKFGSPQVTSVCGEVATENITLKRGWNIIGPYDQNIAVANISTTPLGILSSDFFEFTGVYNSVDTLEVGKGYWVKSAQDGEMILDNPLTNVLAKSSKEETAAQNPIVWTKLVASDGLSGFNINLYAGIDPTATEEVDEPLGESELPPPAPSSFDARFRFPESTLEHSSYKDYRTGDYTYQGSYVHRLEYQLTSGSPGLTLYLNICHGLTMRIEDLGGGTIINQFFEEGTWAFFNPLTTALNGLKITITYDGTMTPVELTSFSGRGEGEKVILEWETATEINNKGFEIERRSEKGEWEKVAYVNGNGSTTEKSEYSFADKVTNLSSTKVSYRLKQIDFDGTYSYSNEITVEILPKEYKLEQNYPNPFNPITKIKYTLPNESEVKISIYNT
ncbi:MAG: YCF48-related protein, partial [bacterium]